MNYKELLKDKYLCTNDNISQKLSILNQKHNEGKLLRYSTDDNSWVSLYNKDTNEYYTFNTLNKNIHLKNMKTLKDINKSLIQKYGDDYIHHPPKPKTAKLN